jgi:hypothetical protein
MQAIKKAIFSTVDDDATIRTLLGSVDRVLYRRPVSFAILPVITFFLVSGTEDMTVPQIDESYQLDVWSRSADFNDVIADRLRTLLHKKPLTLESGRLAGIFVTSTVELYETDTLIHHKVVNLRVISYP